MIINNTYFKGELYINQAKPSIMDSAALDQEFNLILNKYEEDCLEKVLGESLYRDFLDNFDANEDTLIKTGSDAKWNDLLNGRQFTENGTVKYWKGIRFKSPLSNTEYNRSFLANYVYFFYKRNHFTFSTETGEKKIKAANAINSHSNAKAVRAWNEFVEMVQGKEEHRQVYEKYGMLGVDYYKGNNSVTLYEFITWANNENNSYPLFDGQKWERVNDFDL